MRASSTNSDPNGSKKRLCKILDKRTSEDPRFRSPPSPRDRRHHAKKYSVTGSICLVEKCLHEIFSARGTRGAEASARSRDLRDHDAETTTNEPICLFEKCLHEIFSARGSRGAEGSARSRDLRDHDAEITTNEPICLFGKCLHEIFLRDSLKTRCDTAANAPP
jgi:hypothetical protein